MSMTDADKACMRRMWKDGESLKAISGRFGVSVFHVKCTVDPSYRQQRCAQVRTARHKREPAEARKGLRLWDGDDRAGRIPKDEFMKRLAEIPADTRGLTQRLFGDPLPGRSALDQRREA